MVKDISVEAKFLNDLLLDWSWTNRRVESLLLDSEALFDVRHVSIDINSEKIIKKIENIKKEGEGKGKTFYIPLGWFEKNSMLPDFDIWYNNQKISLVPAKESLRILIESLIFLGEEENIDLTTRDENFLWNLLGHPLGDFESVSEGLSKKLLQEINDVLENKQKIIEWDKKTTYSSKRKTKPDFWKPTFPYYFKNIAKSSKFFERFCLLLQNYTPLVRINFDETLDSRILKFQYRTDSAHVNLRRKREYFFPFYFREKTNTVKKSKNTWLTMTTLTLRMLNFPESSADKTFIRLPKNAMTTTGCVAFTDDDSDKANIYEHTVTERATDYQAILRRDAFTFGDSKRLNENYSIVFAYAENASSWRASFVLQFLTCLTIALFILVVVWHPLNNSNNSSFSAFTSLFFTPILGFGTYFTSSRADNPAILGGSPALRDFFLYLGIGNATIGAILVLIGTKFNIFNGLHWNLHHPNVYQTIYFIFLILFFLINAYYFYYSSRRQYILRKFDRENKDNIKNGIYKYGVYNHKYTGKIDVAKVNPTNI